LGIIKIAAAILFFLVSLFVLGGVIRLFPIGVYRPGRMLKPSEWHEVFLGTGLALGAAAVGVLILTL